MTYLKLVNKVLRRLREDQVTSVSDSDYAALIAEFVAQAVSEVEDAWDWNVLRNTIQITTAADDFNYSLTGAGTSFKVFDVHEDTNDYDLTKASYHKMNHWLLSEPASGMPTYWDINGQDSNGDPVVNFYPVPDAATYKVNFNMKIKTDLSDDTTGSTDVPVPWLPIVLRATELGIEERGDDQGLSLTFLQDQFTKALGDAIAYDAALHEDETIWYED
jgi:hypothetical protein